MEPTFRTSFIPKKNLEQGATHPKRAGLGVFTLLTLIILLGAVTVGVGAFLYKQILISSIAKKTETLERARGAFEPALIEELIRLDSRITNAQTVLNDHIAPSLFFDALENLTLKSVRFRDFSYTRIGKDKISITMKGNARDFAGIALQADIFGKNRIIKEPIFSNLNLDNDGNALFELVAFIDPLQIRYIEAVTGADASSGGEIINNN
jgi:hypothetical protein